VPRILVAEGHGPTRDFVQRSLADAGHEVLLADDARAVLALFAARRPDAIVLAADFEGDPADLARKLRAADPRVVLVVADKEHLGRARGLPAVLPLGANAYLADPTRRDLVERVGQLVAQAAAARPARPGEEPLPRDADGTGEIQTGVVARLLHQLWKSRSEGVLVIEEPAAERRLLLVRGAVAAFWSPDPAETLLRWLALVGRVSDAAHDATLEAMAGGLSPGAALVAAGVVEAGEPLVLTLRNHLRFRIVRAVGTHEGRWRFHAGARLGPDVAPVDLPAPLQPVLEGARFAIPARHQLDALRAVTGAYPTRAPEFQALVAGAALGPGDLRLALGLDGHSTTRAWLEARRHELREALSLLWFLSLTGAVVFQNGPVATTPVPARPAVRRRRPLPPEKAETLRQAAFQLLPGSHYQALGLDITADTEDVERAYHEVARRYHPDGFAEYEVGDLEDLLVAVQDKVSAAYRTLSAAEKRRQYLALLVRRLEQTGARRPGVDPAAEIALVRAERALKARRITDAVEALREAVHLSPKEPEYLALLAFASLHDPVLPRAERAQEARRVARRALALQPDHPRASASLALAEAALGDAAEARKVVVSGLRAHPANRVLREVLRRLNHPAGEPRVVN
jgi:CheY-like chemotaxis protein/tetratricopeptide (TPR) repeat protein